MITKTINLYTFDELSDKAKENARQWWRDLENESFSSDLDLEWIETAAKLLGITFKQRGDKRKESCVWWELHRQGAGASFDGTYGPVSDPLAVTKEFPTDTELARIANELAEVQSQARLYQISTTSEPDGITATIQSDSRYHSLNIDTDFDLDSAQDGNTDRLREALRDFARWIYKHINEEYDSRMTDEYVDDAILANDYTFTASGKFESK